MQNTLSLPPFRPSENEDPILNVVIAYEDFETGKQAKNTYDHLVDQLGEEFRFNNQMWKFDVLTVPKLKEMAAKDAAAADVIIIAAHGKSDLPREVKSWLEMAFAEGIHALGLVALFDHDVQESPAQTYLASIAESAHLAFFSSPGDLNKTETGLGGSRTGSDTWSFLTDGLEDRNVSRWGINE